MVRRSARGGACSGTQLALSMWRGRPVRGVRRRGVRDRRGRATRGITSVRGRGARGRVGRAGPLRRGHRPARGRDRVGAVPGRAAGRVDVGVGPCRSAGRGACARSTRTAACSRRRLASIPRRSSRALNDDILRQHPDLGVGAPGRARPSSRAAGRHGDLPVHRSRGLDAPVAGTSRRHGRGVGPSRRDPPRRGGGAPGSGGQDHGRRHPCRRSRTPVTRSTAAVDAQRALQAEPWGETGALRVRMGVHTGEPSQRDGDYYGPPVNQAARLMGIAHGGQIVCSGLVAELAGDRYDARGSGSAPAAGRRVVGAGVPGARAGSGVQFPAARVAGRLPVEPPRQAEHLRRARRRRHRGGEGAGREPGRVDRRRGGRGQDPPRVAGGLGAAVRVRGRGVVVRARRRARPGGRPRSGRRGVGIHAVPGCLRWPTASPGSSGTSSCCWCWTTASTCLGAVAGFVRARAEEAPQLSVLATSREALGIHGERTYPLPALELPADASPFSVEESEAGALFASRAREARGSFEVTDENAAASPTCARTWTATRSRSSLPRRARR